MAALSEFSNVDEASSTNEKLRTQVEQLTKKLDTKKQEIDEFVQIVAHDLKTPLSGIAALTELLKMEYEEVLDPQANEWLGMVLDRTHNLAEMINSVYEYAKAGEVESNCSTFKVEKAVTEVIGNLPKRDVFEINVPDQYPTISCYYSHLTAVLTQLLENAVKHHDKESGEITLIIENANEHQLCFSIIDDGPGIAEVYHSIIFTVFKIAKEEHPKDGSGIGLTIAKKIVEQNGGQIGLLSTPGQGSKFWFTWPKNYSDSTAVTSLP